jgi:hypothetical protein
MSLQVSEMLDKFQCTRTEQNDKLIIYLFKQKLSVLLHILNAVR